MANLVEQIIDGFESLISTTLGANYNILNYKYAVEKNTFRGNSLRYGVRPLAATTTNGTLKHYTVDQEFQVILTRDWVGSSINDTNKETSIKGLYDDADSILTAAINNKLGVPTIVLDIPTFIENEVEFIDQSNVAILRVDVTVKYRKSLI